MPNEERKNKSFRKVDGENVRPRTSLTQYRVLHGPKIRRYYSIGDPVRDRAAGANLAKLVAVVLLIAGFLFLVVMAIKRMAH